VLWQPFQPTPCRPLNPIRLSTGKLIAELIDPPQRCETAQFAADAKPDQAEPDQENHEPCPAQRVRSVEQRTYKPGAPERRDAEPKSRRSDKCW
jgi:hypothetical protein